MKAKITGFDEVDKMFDEFVDDLDDIVDEALDAGAEVLLDETKKAIDDAVSQHPGQFYGGLSRSLYATKSKRNSFGKYKVVTPVGSDSDGIKYTKKAAMLEFGTHWPKKAEDAEKIHHKDKAGQKKNKPTPWRQKAVNRAEKKVQETMGNVVSDEMEKRLGYK